jgi:hypothetical protein
MSSALLPNRRRRDKVPCEQTVVVGGPRSVNDLPDEVLLKILSHFGPEDLCFLVPEVCERWNALSKDVTLWKALSYSCDDTDDISRIEQVRCAALLWFRGNWILKLAPSSV